MSWGVVIGLAGLLALLSLVRYVRIFVWGFAVSATVLLILHARQNPAEALPALAVLGGGLGLIRPLRRVVTGGWV